MAQTGRITLQDLKARVNALDNSNMLTIRADAKLALSSFLTYLDDLDNRITQLESEAINGNRD